MLDCEPKIVSKRKCSEMIPPPSVFYKEYRNFRTRDVKASLMVMEEMGKIILDHPLYSEAFLLVSCSFVLLLLPSQLQLQSLSKMNIIWRTPNTVFIIMRMSGRVRKWCDIIREASEWKTPNVSYRHFVILLIFSKYLLSKIKNQFSWKRKTDN